jgi:ATP-dependent Lhr-like helicase
LTDDARRVLAILRDRGASFFNDLRALSGLDADTTRVALGALVATGIAHSDGFSGLRALLVADPTRPALRDRRVHFAGRWTAVESAAADASREEIVEANAWSLLRRYGVIFRRLLERENIAAPWRELTRVYRRLEARGEIRGGRFVSGMSGEQFALPRAVERLREIRRSPADGTLIAISTADPLNLAGIVTAGDRMRAATRNRVVYRDGTPIAVREGDIVRELTPLDASELAAVSIAIARKAPVPVATFAGRAHA